jgi:hypothetical protein
MPDMGLLSVEANEARGLIDLSLPDQPRARFHAAEAGRQ